jgi:hypothetical protein
MEPLDTARLIIFNGKLLPSPTYTVQKQKEVISCITEQKAGT